MRLLTVVLCLTRYLRLHQRNGIISVQASKMMMIVCLSALLPQCHGFPALRCLWSRRAAAWRQQILERVCRPAVAGLGQQAGIKGDQHADDDLEAAAKHQLMPKGRSRQLHASGRRHQRFADEDPLQSPAWDKHCTASMLAGMCSHLFRNLSASLYSAISARAVLL